jgi:DNA-binding response OmpR family regulator
MSTALLLADPVPPTLVRHLADDGFDVLAHPERKPDIVLLEDISQLDRWSGEQVPVIVLGRPHADAVDRVRAFERGCDDFLSQPFVYAELLARIRAVLRRTAPARGRQLVCGELVVDPPTRRVTIDGRPVLLSGKEFELVAKLATDPDRVFTKDELLRDVWGYRATGRTRTLDSHASRVRRKLGAVAGDNRYVVNVWGVGYRLVE